jgi:nucleoside-diphosphate-sugar epimerase
VRRIGQHEGDDLRGGSVTETIDSRRVVVTGARGKLGRAVVREFVASGYQVVGVDLAPGDPVDGVRFVRADLREFGEVVELLTGIDDVFGGTPGRTGAEPPVGVVHLGATPAPGLRPNAATWRDNTAATYNVFSAARLAGVTRVVFASSETLLGLPFEQVPPPHLPVDESYPVRPQSSYSLSKAVDEEVARHFAAWLPDAGFLGLRFSNVMAPEDYARFPGYDADPHERSWNAWGYVDARDGALACRLALESDVTGAHNYVIAAADTVMSTPSAELAAAVFAGVPLRDGVDGVESLLSSEQARRDFGYVAQWSWRTQL